MYDKLQLYLDINNLQETEWIKEACNFLHEDSNKQIISLTNKGYIIKNYQNLLNSSISLEDFMYHGDFNFKNYMYQDTGYLEAVFEMYYTMKFNKEYAKDSLVLVDSISFEYFDQVIGNNLIEDLVKERNSRIFGL